MHIEPNQKAVAQFVTSRHEGPIVMLNLLRFREFADYANAPQLAPASPISGRVAYDLYLEHFLPFLREAGGEIVFRGRGHEMMIGPDNETWDLILLIKHKSAEAFLSLAMDRRYLDGLGHRNASLVDSRLLPMSTY